MRAEVHPDHACLANLCNDRARVLAFCCVVGSSAPTFLSVGVCVVVCFCRLSCCLFLFVLAVALLGVRWVYATVAEP